MADDFVFGFLQQMDGEKDPRNLVLLFSIVPVFYIQAIIHSLADCDVIGHFDKFPDCSICRGLLHHRVVLLSHHVHAPAWRQARCVCSYR